jgi:hypothetical protein
VGEDAGEEYQEEEDEDNNSADDINSEEEIDRALDHEIDNFKKQKEMEKQKHMEEQVKKRVCPDAKSCRGGARAGGPWGPRTARAAPRCATKKLTPKAI